MYVDQSMYDTIHAIYNVHNVGHRINYSAECSIKSTGSGGMYTVTAAHILILKVYRLIYPSTI
jgi:hypothetical protein